MSIGGLMKILETIPDTEFLRTAKKQRIQPDIMKIVQKKPIAAMSCAGAKCRNVTTRTRTVTGYIMDAKAAQGAIKKGEKLWDSIISLLILTKESL